MLRGLGGNTKSFKSYGKQKTNTKNRIVVNWADSSAENSLEAIAPVQKGRKVENESESGESESEVEVKEKKSRKGILQELKNKRLEKENLGIKKIEKGVKAINPSAVAKGKKRAPIVPPQEELEEEFIETDLIIERNPLQNRVEAGRDRPTRKSDSSRSSRSSKGEKSSKNTPSPQRIISVLPDSPIPSPILLPSPIATTSQLPSPPPIQRNSKRMSKKSSSATILEDSFVEEKVEPVIASRRSSRSSRKSVEDVVPIKRVSRSSVVVIETVELEAVAARSSRRSSKRSVMEPEEAQVVVEEEEELVEGESEYLSIEDVLVDSEEGEESLQLEEELAEDGLVEEVVDELESEEEVENIAIVGRVSRSHASLVIDVELEEEEEEEEEELSVTEDELDELESTLSEISLDSLPIPIPLQPLLSLTTSPNLYNFTDFLDNSPSPFTTAPWKKIGEASYSEVFSTIGKAGVMVIKVIPIDLHDLEEGEADEPYKSEVESIIREVEIGTAVNREGMTGFVKFLGSFVVQGSYPTVLLDEWDRFKENQFPFSEEQIRPEGFGGGQHYILICLEHGGEDLETVRLRNWVEASSILFQVAEICEKAEELIDFEHRDLHWGNVLVKPVENLSFEFENLRLTPKKKIVNGTPTTATPATLKVTLIDFTLSRADLGEKIVFDEFEDECIFEGEGDEQFDVYRSMRNVTKSNWEGFYPITNLLWLHYLTLKLLNSKKLKPPPIPSASSTNRFDSPATASPLRNSMTNTRATRAVTPATRRARTLPIKKSINSIRGEEKERAAWEKLVESEKVLRGLGEKKKGRGGKKRFAEMRDFLNWWEEN